MSAARYLGPTDHRGARIVARCDAYTVVLGADGWGVDSGPVSDDEHDAACERMEEWLTEHECDALSISVRSPRRGEICGTYHHDQRGQMWLRSSVHPEPDAVRDLVQAAWEHACETWPAVDCDDAGGSS